MAAEYDFFPKPSLIKEGNELLCPRLVSKGTVSVNDIAERIVRATSLSRSDIIAVMAVLEDMMAEYISSGYHFELGNVGYFWGKLGSRPVEDEKEIHAQSVSFVNVNFRASSTFKKACKGKVEKSKKGFCKSRDISEDDCRAMTVEYLDINHTMSVTDFCSFTGLLRGKGKELVDKWVKEKFIVPTGRSTHKVYYLK